MTNRITLRGCSPDPMLHYLKALGVLRLVAEQFDPHVRGAWVGDEFALETSRTPDDLMSYFLYRYAPTPIVAPWNGGSGFYPKDRREAVNAIKQGASERFVDYRETISVAKRIVGTRTESPKDEEKAALLRDCRNEFPDRAVRWLDAAYVLGAEKPDYPPLLGTGGNDGRLEFTNNFMARLIATLPEAGSNAKQVELSAARLRAALFGDCVSPLEPASVGQYHPGGIGGPNATEGLGADSLVNPWDFILGIEGALAFAGATVRQLAVGARSRASYPFTVQSSPVGYGTAAAGEEVRAEMWLPLWPNFSGSSEVAHLFGEGRARFETGRGKSFPVRSGFDFARSAAALGADRGITAFQRFGFLVRNGKAYLATSLGRFDIEERPITARVGDFDAWLAKLQRATRDETRTPPRFIRVRARVEEAVFALCAADESRQADCLRDLLLALGEAEHETAGGQKFRTDNDIPPMFGLRNEWVSKCRNGLSPEEQTDFDIAAALASIHGRRSDEYPLRCNLEAVDKTEGVFKWSANDNRVVWRAGDLAENLAAVLHRRSIDARSSTRRDEDDFRMRDRLHTQPLPAIEGVRTASLKAVDALLRGRTDDRRIESYLRALMLVSFLDNTPEISKRTPNDELPPISRIHALLKLLFLPGGGLILTPDQKAFVPIPTKASGKAVPPGTRFDIRHEPRIVPLLRSGSIGYAVEIALRRLRATGLRPKFRDEHFPHEDGPRLAAALLVPIADNAVSMLAGLVLRLENPKSQTVREENTL